MSELARRRHYQHQDLWDRFWKDRYGEVVVYQRPNLVLIGWAVITIVSLFLNGTASDVAWWVALGVLSVWSLLEMFRGVNYLRRIFGAIVLIMVVAAIFKVGY